MKNKSSLRTLPKFLPVCAALTLGAVILSGQTAAQAQFPTTNLLANPGAETGAITPWVSTSDGSLNPGVDNGAFDPGINPHTGSFDFYGGTNTLGTLTQSVTLVGTQGITAAQIDTGNLKANINFWEQGLNQGTPSDDASVTLLFKNAASTTLSTVTSTTIDSHVNIWQQDIQSFGIPATTRTIAYQINFMKNQGGDNDSFVDDTSLIVSNVGTGAAPEPSAFALLAGSLPLAGGILMRRRRNAA